MSTDPSQEIPGKTWRVGDTISDRYRLTELIGEGGMGSVFKARDLKLGKVVAVKTLSGRELNDDDFVRFHREAKVASTISHTNVVETYDFGVTGNGQPFLVMQLIEGVTLKKLLARQGVLNLSTALQILAQIAGGMCAVHSAGIIHRDLKTSNVMVKIDSGTVTVKLLDFGVARRVQVRQEGIDPDKKQQYPGSETLTKSGEIIGTPRYLSPEQALGIPVDERSDIYSLGCIAFEMFSGKPPFAGDTVFETIQMHLDAYNRPTLPSDAHLPESLRKLIEKMIARFPEDRIQSMSQLRSEIDKSSWEKEYEELRESQEPGLSQRESAARSDKSIRFSPLVLVLAVVALVFVAAFAFVIMHTLSPEKSEVSNKKPVESMLHIERKKSKTVIVAGPPMSFLFINPAGSKLLAASAERLARIPVIIVDTPVSDEDVRNIVRLKPEWILLSRAGVTDEHLEMLSRCNSIEELRLFKTKRITFRGIKNLRRLTRLIYLSVRDCDMDDLCLKELAGMGRLEVLDLEGNKKVTLKGLSVLSACPNLKVLTVWRTGIKLEPGDDQRLTKRLHLAKLWTGKTFDSDGAMATMELFQDAEGASPLGSGEVPTDLRGVYGEYGRKRQNISPAALFAE